MKYHSIAPAARYRNASPHLLFKSLLLILFSVLITAPTLAQSPRKIAYTFGGSPASVIAVINEDGTGQTLLTTPGWTDQNPTWSPDGSAIAFESNRNAGRFNIYRMSADGSGLVPLTDFAEPFSNSSPSWSPDGTKILFTTNRNGERKQEIWVMKADGTNLVQLTTNIQLASDSFGPVFNFDRDPSWSPDGSRIVFSSNRHGLTSSELYLMNPDGSNQTRLTTNAAVDEVPSWLPDGQHISFFSRGPGRDGLYVIDSNGANDHQLATSGFETSWAPDGLKIALTDFDPSNMSAMAIYLTDSNGGGKVRLTNNGTTDSRMAAWQMIGGPAPPPPPTTPTYTATGKVVDSSVNPFNPPGIPGLPVSLTGTISATTTTDANGQFTFAGLPQDGNYTVTPSNASWGMFPTTKSFSTTFPLTGFDGRTINMRFDASPIFEQFETDTYSANEGSNAVVSVRREGFITGTSTIHYTTSNGTAQAGQDYVATSGTLTFNPGDSVKTFSIPITYDKTPESGETINLTLSNPTGSTSRGRQTAVLTISDPAPTLVTEGFTTQAGALNALNGLRDPFPLTTAFLGQNSATRVALFARFVDLLPDEDVSAVTVTGRAGNQVVHQLPVEAVVAAQTVGDLPAGDSLTQITVRLPTDLPAGDLFINVSLRGLTSSLFRIRIQ